MSRISIVTPCFNEEEIIQHMYNEVKKVMADLPQYEYEHLFIDNASSDQTVAILRDISAQDSHVKVIVNTRNFGHIRSPYHGITQASGDAVILMVADLQDPPHLIKDFLQKWKEGFKIVIGIKQSTHEKFPLSVIRRWYYRFVTRIAEVPLHNDFTGFGLYDRAVVNILRELDDPYCYFRGLIADLGFKTAKIPYHQPLRVRGITKNNFYTLYDMAMLGITTHSKVPIRLATLAGFSLAFMSLLVAASFLLLKLFFWSYFPIGIAPMLIAIFFFASVQLFFIGLLGEYILSIHTQVLKRPRVVEAERINC